VGKITYIATLSNGFRYTNINNPFTIQNPQGTEPYIILYRKNSLSEGIQAFLVIPNGWSSAYKSINYKEYFRLKREYSKNRKYNSKVRTLLD